MTTQTIIRTIPFLHLFELAPAASAPVWWNEEAQRSFYEDEAELARELSAPVPACLVVQQTAKIDPGEFEAAYQWFLA